MLAAATTNDAPYGAFIFLAFILIIILVGVWVARSNAKDAEAARAKAALEATFGWQLRQKVDTLRDAAWSQRIRIADANLKKTQAEEITSLTAKYTKRNGEGTYPTEGPWAQAMQEMLERHTREKISWDEPKADFSEADKVKAEGFAFYTADGPRPWEITYKHRMGDWTSVNILALSAEEAIAIAKKDDAHFQFDPHHVIDVWPAE